MNFQDSTYADYTIGSAAGPVYQPADDFSGFWWQAQVTHADLAAAGRLRAVPARAGAPIFQEAATGRYRQLTGEVDLRPVPTVRTALTATVFRLDRLDGREFARSTIPRLKVEYQPKRELFFRVIGEYRSDGTAALEDPATGAPLYIGGAAQPASEFNGLRVDLLASSSQRPARWPFSATAARSRRTRSSTGRGCRGRAMGSS